LNSSPVRWNTVPAPAEPVLAMACGSGLGGLDEALIVAPGTRGLTAIRIAAEATMVIGAKSFSVSYGSLA
jgi:hypothetical protein